MAISCALPAAMQGPARNGLTLKDLRLALAADEVTAPMPLADVVYESLLEAAARGDGARDLAALARVSMRRVGADDSLILEQQLKA